MAFSPDGKLLASVESDGTVRLWNPATGRPAGPPLRAATGQHGGVNAMAFSPDGKLLASVDSDGTVRLWNPATGQSLGTALSSVGPGGVYTAAFSPDGKLLASASPEGTMRLWNVSLLTNPYVMLCTDVGPPTRQEWNQYAPGEPFPRVCA